MLTKEVAIEALYWLTRSRAIKSFTMLKDSGLETIQFTNPSDQAVSFPLATVRIAVLERMIGFHKHMLSFAPIRDYPEIVEEYSHHGLDLNDEDIIYSTVYSLHAKCRVHAPALTLTGLIVARGDALEVYGNLAQLESLSALSDDERIWNGKAFALAIGNTVNFSGDKAKSYCDTSFVLHRYDSLSDTDPVVSSKHSIDDWVGMAIEVRLSHEALVLRDSIPTSESLTQNFYNMEWTYEKDGRLWATGTVSARYDGTRGDTEKIRRGDPRVAELLSNDSVSRDIQYSFEYCFEFNALGRITALHIYRDVETLVRCYQFNSHDIDAILLSATKKAGENSNGKMVDQIIDLSRMLYAAEQKELAITKLFQAVDIASYDNRDLAVDAMGTAIYKMMKDR